MIITPQTVFIIFNDFKLNDFFSILTIVPNEKNQIIEAVHAPNIKYVISESGMDALREPNNIVPSKIAWGLAQVTKKQDKIILNKPSLDFKFVSMDGLLFNNWNPIIMIVIDPKHKINNFKIGILFIA